MKTLATLVPLLVAGAALLTAAPAGQARAGSQITAGSWTPAKTPWGDPDIDGI